MQRTPCIVIIAIRKPAGYSTSRAHLQWSSGGVRSNPFCLPAGGGATANAEG